MTPDIEVPLKVNMTTNKAILIDVLILGILLCAFLAGLWYGQKQQGEEKIAFFKDYIENECSCQKKLIFEKNNAYYEKVVYPAQFQMPKLP